MENLRELWNKTCLNAGIPAISTDTAARIMAVVYIHGNNEAFTFNQKFIADMEYIQERFGIYGAGVPECEFARLLKGYVKELKEFTDGNTAYYVNPNDVTHKRCKSCGRMLPIEKFCKCRNSDDVHYDYAWTAIGSTSGTSVKN